MNGEEIRIAREAAGIEVKEAAKALDMSPEQWEKMERGTISVPPTVELLFHATLDWLLTVAERSRLA